jgi:predicted CopG family antitoxin
MSSEKPEKRRYISITTSAYKKLTVVKHQMEEEEEKVLSFSEVIERLCEEYISGEGLYKEEKPSS